MGRKATATRENVVAAIKHLRVMQGSRAAVSARNIRQVIGGGSLNTITKLKKEIQREQPELFEDIKIDGIGDIQKHIDSVKQKLDEIPYLLVLSKSTSSHGIETQNVDELKNLRHKLNDFKSQISIKNKYIQELEDRIQTLEKLGVVASDIQIIDRQNIPKLEVSSSPAKTEDFDNPKDGDAHTNENQMFQNNKNTTTKGNVTTADKKSKRPKAQKATDEDAQLPLFSTPQAEK